MQYSNGNCLPRHSEPTIRAVDLAIDSISGREREPMKTVLLFICGGKGWSLFYQQEEKESEKTFSHSPCYFLRTKTLTNTFMHATIRCVMYVYGHMKYPKLLLLSIKLYSIIFNKNLPKNRISYLLNKKRINKR